MAASARIAKYWNSLSPFWQREISLFGLLFGFGLLVMPFLIYLAGVMTLGPYEGGLLTFLGSLMGAVFTAKLSAWILVIGPYLMFSTIRLLTRPFRRQA